MVPKWPDTMADMVIAKCVRNRWLNAFFPILILFGAHILSFHEWIVVYQWLGDNSDVTCVPIGKSTWNIYVKRYIFRFFLVLQGSTEALIRWGGKIEHLLIACFLSNISAKYYENPTMLSRVVAKNIGDVFETQCTNMLFKFPRHKIFI